MRRFKHEFLVKRDINTVWNFFMDPRHIETVSPGEFNEVLLRCSTDRLSLNTDLWVSTSLFLKKRWHSKITRFDEFHEFKDEVQQSRLLKWSHLHCFHKVEDHITLVRDEVEFEFGLGLIGRVIESLVYPRLISVFSHREEVIRTILEK
jgi:ligand-binding SRPBCC domain-containing protein